MAISTAKAEDTSEKVEIVKAVFGVFSTAKNGELTFKRTDTVPLVDDQSYGWIIELRTKRRAVRFRETFSLPIAPKRWGTADEPGFRVSTSPDGKVAVTVGDLDVVGGYVMHAWSVATGDPKGKYSIRVKIEELEEIAFEFNTK